MSPLLTTLQIVLGIISPFILGGIIIGLIYVLVGYLEYLKTIKLYKIEELKKQPPFDSVETRLDFANQLMQVNFIKNNEVIWYGDIKDDDGKLSIL